MRFNDRKTPGELRRFSSNSDVGNLFSVFLSFLNEITNSSEITRAIFLRDIRAKYRESFASYLWLFVPLLIDSGTWIYLNYQGLVQVNETEIPYMLFVFIGTIMWAAFSAGILAPFTAATAAVPVITRLKVPLESFLFSGMLIECVNMVVKLLLVLVAVLLMNHFVPFSFGLFFVCLFLCAFLGMAVGILVLPVGFLIKDFQKVITFVLPLLKYTAPVVFPVPAAGLAMYVMKYNPMTYLIEGGRDWAVLGSSNVGLETVIIGVASVMVFCFGATLIRIVMPRLVERMGM